MASPRDDQKTIFITGAGSGIGRAVAQHFTSRGWFAALADISEAGLAQTAALLGQNSSASFVLDVRDRAQWARVINEYSQLSKGRLDVLFNNAGLGRGGWFEEVPPDDFDLVIDVNLKGVANGVYAALPLLKTSAPSCILNTASVAGFAAPPKMAAYIASKFAVRGLTEALNVEFSRHNIRVASLAPWFVETAILDNRAHGANRTLREELSHARVPIYPVEMVAHQAWRAVHGDKIHYLVGKAAERAEFAARFIPAALRARFRKSMIV